jgi:predicted XRE-type DNA-binding protein
MAQKARKKAKKKVKTVAAALKRDTISRAVLARETQRQIERFGLSREVAAIVVRDAASQVSRLMTGHANEFSADRLVGWLTRLGSDVTITIRHAPRLGRRGKVRIGAR